MSKEYVIFIVEAGWDGAEAAADQDWDIEWAKHHAFQSAVADAGGRVVHGDALEPERKAFRVEASAGGEPLVTAGPFAETREVITGFYAVELPDDVDITPIAALCPTTGWVQVHPVAVLPDPS